MNYGELKELINLYLKRKSLIARIPGFIQLACARVSRDLFVKDMVIRAETTVLAGSRFVSIPPSCKRLIKLEIDNGSGPQGVSLMSQTQLDSFYPEGYSGAVSGYSMVGTELEIRPVPVETTSLYLTYYGRPSAFVYDTDTNQVLTDSPNVYIYATMLEASPFIHADERMPLWKELYAEEVQALNSQEDEMRYSGGYSQIVPLGGDTP